MAITMMKTQTTVTDVAMATVFDVIAMATVVVSDDTSRSQTHTVTYYYIIIIGLKNTYQLYVTVLLLSALS